MPKGKQNNVLQPYCMQRFLKTVKALNKKIPLKWSQDTIIKNASHCLEKIFAMHISDKGFVSRTLKNTNSQ